MESIVIENPLLYVGVGNVIAAILSWKRNQDFLWAVVAFLIGWLYVIYWLLTMDDHE
jgi:hypothetical protein